MNSQVFARKDFFRILVIIAVLFGDSVYAICQDKNTGKSNIHILTPDKNGRLELGSQTTGMCKPGDIIYLRGRFTSIWMEGLNGTAEQPVRISNYPGEVVTVGNPLWNGGAYGQGIHMINCHHFVMGGENSASEFILDGSTQPNRYGYFNLDLRPFTDNAEIRNMTIRNGGMGITAKTDPDPKYPQTWHPNSTLNNLSIHDVKITGVSEEGMYIGHTAETWGWTENGEGYNATGIARQKPGHRYVQPVMWKNVKIYNNYLDNIGNDGIQTAAIDGLEIYGNEVYRWATKKIPYHSGGILVGGRTKNTNVHDNYVHDGYGEMYQFFGSGEGNTPHVVHNNLFVKSTSNGMGIYDEAVLTITGNTIVHTGGYSIQVNGRNVKRTGDHIISNNLLIESALQISFFSKGEYIRVENGATVKENGNLKFDSVKKAGVNPEKFYQPLPDSTAGKAGYRKK